MSDAPETKKPAEAAPPARSPDPLVGRRLAGFQIDAFLSAGAMGKVYRGRQLSLDRAVAIKILSAERVARPDVLDRFRREAKAAAALNHPHLVQVYDFGEEDGMYFYAMELVEGHALGEYVESGQTFKEADCIEIARQTLKGLEAAHRANIIHRDVKPDNLLLSREGKIKLADLGLARNIDNPGESSFSQTGWSVGTPFYMSPEQVRGDADVDFRSDFYGLGTTLFHLATGRPPYAGTSSSTVMALQLNAPVPYANDVNPEVSQAFSDLLCRLMAKRREDRPASHDELFAVLERCENLLKGEARLTVRIRAVPQAGAPVPAAPHATTPARVPTRVTPSMRERIAWPLWIAAGAGLAILGFVIASAMRGPGRTPVTEDGRVEGATAVSQVAAEPSTPQTAGVFGTDGAGQEAKPVEQVSQAQEPAPVVPAEPLPPPAPMLGSGAPEKGKDYRIPGEVEMVWVPPGETTLGSDPEERAWVLSEFKVPDLEILKDESEPRRVKIESGFWMARTELTVAQWRRFAEDTGHLTEAERTGSAQVYATGKVMPTQVEGASWRVHREGKSAEDVEPVVCIAPADAEAFCRWLTEREQSARRLPQGFVYRLPSDEEWEYACRGGQEGNPFWWGDNLADLQGRVNTWSRLEVDGYPLLSPVEAFGLRGRNAFGLADLAGNAGEIVWVGKGRYSLRGGSFNDPPWKMRCAARLVMRTTWLKPSSAVGFRPCCAPSLPATPEEGGTKVAATTPDATATPGATPAGGSTSVAEKPAEPATPPVAGTTPVAPVDPARPAVTPSVAAGSPAQPNPLSVAEAEELGRILAPLTDLAAKRKELIAQRGARYAADLRALEAEVARSGDLEAVLILRREREAWEANRPTATFDSGGKAALSKAQSLRYFLNQELQTLEKQALVAFDRERAVALANLTQMETNLTRAVRIDAAVVIRQKAEELRRQTGFVQEGKPAAGAATGTSPATTPGAAGALAVPARPLARGRVMAWPLHRDVDQVADIHQMPDEVKAATDIVAIAAQSLSRLAKDATTPRGYAAALRADGRVLLWGGVAAGERAAFLMVPPDLDKIVAVSLSELGGLALRENGDLVVMHRARAPVVVPGPFVAVAGGRLALKADGTIWSERGADEGVPPGIGQVRVIGAAYPDCNFAACAEGGVVTWGGKELPSSQERKIVASPQDLRDVVEIAAAYESNFALTARGQVFCLWESTGERAKLVRDIGDLRRVERIRAARVSLPSALNVLVARVGANRWRWFAYGGVALDTDALERESRGCIDVAIGGTHAIGLKPVE